MKDILFLQWIGKMLEDSQVSCSFESPPPIDRTFWNKAVQFLHTEDQQALESIAAILRSGETDFSCIDQIADILSARGFDVGGCHDF